MLNMIILVFMVIYIRICKSKVTLTTISQDLAKNNGAIKIMIIVPGASYGQAYAGSYDATASNYAVNKRSARSLPQVSPSDGVRVLPGRLDGWLVLFWFAGQE